MRTTVDLPEELLAEVQRLSAAPTRREALILAMAEYVRRRRLAELAVAPRDLEFDEAAVGAVRSRDRARARGA